MDQQSSEREYKASVRRAKSSDTREPRAQKARYDAKTRKIVVELKSGATFAFPCDLAQGLAGATDKDLALIKISPSCAGLHWPRLDADFNLPSLIQGVFGSPAWMRQLQRRRAR